jgi:predicted transcriptional regulator
MVTTIQVSQELKDKLSFRKISPKDSYEEVIWDLLEDTMELNEQTKKEIEAARKEFRQGKFVTHAQLKKELGL